MNDKKLAKNNVLEKETDLTQMFWHEVKNPLNAIVGFSQLGSLDESLNGLQKYYFEQIFQSGENISEIATKSSKKDYLKNSNDDSIKDKYWENIRSHLDNISDNLDLLKNESLSESASNYVNMLKTTNERIEKHYGLSKLKNLSIEELKKHSTNFDLENLVGEVVEGFKQNLDKFGLSVKMDVKGDTNLYANYDTIHAMLTTLLGNSLNFAPKYSTIKLKIKSQNDELHITSRNQYMEDARKLNGTNRGLGIPYVKVLTTNMGGEFSSKKGLGYFRTNVTIPKDLSQIDN